MNPGDDPLKLVRAVCAGDRDAATRFFAILYRVAVKMEGADAGSEIANQVFLDFLERDWAPLRGWRGEGKLESWLFTIVRNKSRRRRVPVSLGEVGVDESVAEDPSPLERLVRESERVALLLMVDRLPVERDRVVIRMRYLQEKNSDQVARELGISKTVEYQVHSRALKRLRELFAERSQSHAIPASGI